MALPAVEELWSLTVCSRCQVMLGMLEHTVVGKSMIPPCIPSVLGLLLETPQTLQQPWRRMFNGGAGNRGTKEGSQGLWGDQVT